MHFVIWVLIIFSHLKAKGRRSKRCQRVRNIDLRAQALKPNWHKFKTRFLGFAWGIYYYLTWDKFLNLIDDLFPLLENINNNTYLMGYFSSEMKSSTLIA